MTARTGHLVWYCIPGLSLGQNCLVNTGQPMVSETRQGLCSRGAYWLWRVTASHLRSTQTHPHVTGTSVLKDKQVPGALGTYAGDLPWTGEAEQAFLEVTFQLCPKR